MSRLLDPVKHLFSALWKWVRTTRHVSGLATILAVLVVLAMQWQGTSQPFDDSPRNGVELLERRGWIPPTEPILWLRYLLPYLEMWLLVGGVVFHIAILRAWPRPRRMVRPVWAACLFVAAWAVASDVSTHLEYLVISVTGEPATPNAYIAKLVMIVLACVIPAAGLQLYARSSLLNQYTLRSFLGPAVFCFIAFCSLYILMDLLDSLRDFQDNKIPLRKMLLFYLHLIPFIFVSVAPAAILLGVLYSLTKMSRSNEIVAQLGAGRSVAQILAPVFTSALAASFIALAANYYWAPRAEGNRQAIMRALTEGEAGTIMSEALLYHNPETRRTWYAGSFPFNLRDEKIRNIEVRQQNEKGQLERTWIARSAMWWPTSAQWRFYQGQEIRYTNGKPTSLIDFTGRLPGTPSKLDVQGISETPWSIVSSALVPDFMGVPDLISYLKAHGDSADTKLNPFRTHLHHRFAFPFQCFVLALVAAPLGIAYSRRGSLGGIAARIFIFFGMIFVNDLFISLGKGGHLPPALSVWIPNLAFGLLGGVMLYLRSQNKELPKLSLKTARVARPRNRSAAPSPA
jgi:LPS export ABC transporter permease LptG